MLVERMSIKHSLKLYTRQKVNWLLCNHAFIACTLYLLNSRSIYLVTALDVSLRCLGCGLPKGVHGSDRC